MADIMIAEEQKAVDDLIVGNSPAMIALKHMIKRVAHSDASIMITGPSGSGKEMVAQAIHAESNRNSNKFVALNCGAVPAELMESELFGHERGSFTGANSRRIGRFEESDKGTLFLDEIGDMPYDMQVKLLRVLEDGKVNRVGSNNCIPVNVRIISATHQNIDQAITTNTFREDLYFRLGVVPVVVPGLAERAQDIPLLVRHFQKSKTTAQLARFDSSATNRLMAHNWPGNVRELRNIVERAGVLFGGEMITAAHVDQLLNLSPRNMAMPAGEILDLAVKTESQQSPEPVAFDELVSAPMAAPTIDPLATASSLLDGPINLREMLENMELERIQLALETADGVISEAARLLTLKRTTLIEKMRKYGVEKLC